MELSESPAAAANDAEIGSSECPSLLGLILPHRFCPVGQPGEDPVAQNLTGCRPGAYFDLETGLCFLRPFDISHPLPTATAALSLGAGLSLRQLSSLRGSLRNWQLDEAYAVTSSTSNPIPRQKFETSSKYPSK